MAEKMVKRVVTHPRLYLSVSGKLQHVKAGTEITLSESEAKRMATRVADPASVKKLVDGKLVDGGASESEAIAALKAELEAAKAENGKLTADVEAAKAENGKLTADVEAAKAENGKLTADVEAAKAENGKLTEALKATGAQLTALQKSTAKK